jgi:hypothetical protein
MFIILNQEMSMKKWILIFLALGLTACIGFSTNTSGVVPTNDSQPVQFADGGTMTQAASALEDLGPAPEWENEVWLNTDHPLPLADLHGQVVLLEMWTFG